MINKNLLENVEWISWFPRKELSPEFFIDGQKLKIVSNNNQYSYGKVLSDYIFISNSHIVIFEADFIFENIENIEKSVFGMIDFYDNNKIMLERTYVDIVEKDSVKKLYVKLDAPENAEYIKIELGLRYCANAVVEFNNINFETVESEPPRIVRIATTYKEQQNTLEESLQDMIDVIDKTGKSNPDVILLSECIYESCYENLTLDEKAQPVPGPLTNKIGEYAKKYNTYIIFSMNEKDGDFIFNTAVIIGRDGKLCGTYRKTHLPLSEAESGTSPGNEHKVFDLDFGRIGVIICYDQQFPENSRTLALMGAEIIFIPTMGEDEVVQRAIARTNGVYTVVSGYRGSKHSRIINPLGEVVNFVTNKESVYAIEEIDLNKRFFVYWMSIGAGNGELKSLFRIERNIETYGNINKESYKLKK
jgi:predicted amidohydrolase